MKALDTPLAINVMLLSNSDCLLCGTPLLNCLSDNTVGSMVISKLGLSIAVSI